MNFENFVSKTTLFETKIQIFTNCIKGFMKLIFLVGIFALIGSPYLVFSAPTIKKLLDKAKPGQTVRLPSGTFIEEVVVPPGISVVGANARKTVIVGNIQLTAMPQFPVSLSRITVIHTGGRSSRAVSCDGGEISIYNSHLISEGGFATVSAGAKAKVLLQNNIIVGPGGDYAVFGRDEANINIINNTIIVQGFGVGLMDKSFANIRNCLFYGARKPAIIRTDSDYSISYTNISLPKGSFYLNHDLINGDIQLRDPYNYRNNATPADLSNKDTAKYDSLGLTFLPHKFVKFKDIKEYRKNVPDFSFHAGSPRDKDKNKDGSRNHLGAFGGAFGDNW